MYGLNDQLYAYDSHEIASNGYSYVCSLVQELMAQAITYDSFDDMISAAIGMDPNTNHLVQFYRLSRDIVTFATNSRTGRNLVDWAHTYFRRHLLPWIVNNNGLVSLSYTLCALFYSPVELNN
jgi:hypothetical protein